MRYIWPDTLSEPIACFDRAHQQDALQWAQAEQGRQTMSTKKRKGKFRRFRVGQVVYDKYEGYCGYAKVKRVRLDALLLVDNGGNHWYTPIECVRPLTARERGKSNG